MSETPNPQLILGWKMPDEEQAFTLPLDYVTQAHAVLANRGGGKTYTSAVIVEELLERGQQVVVLDPTGVWWGLKSSADGKKAGFPIMVLGGDHQDLPLPEVGGTIVAMAVLENRLSVVLDMSEMSKAGSKRFVADFLSTLYRKSKRRPLHVVIDEANQFAPQRAMGEDARCLGAVEDVVLRGRAKGLGVTLISQRPAHLHKDVLTQCEMLIALRMSHPRDIGAIKEWVETHAAPEEAKQLISSLPSMVIGTAWFWSPGWGQFQELVAVRKRATFDSSATPKIGQTIIEPQVMAEVDLSALAQELMAAAEEVDNRDPRTTVRELRAEIARLKQQKGASPEELTQAKIVGFQMGVSTAIKVLEKVTIVDLAEPRATEVIADPASVRMIDQLVADLKPSLPQAAGDVVDELVHITEPRKHMVEAVNAPSMRYATVADVAHAAADGLRNDLLRGSVGKILMALAQVYKPLDRNRLALHSQVSVKSSGFGAALSTLRKHGYITEGWPVSITQAGRDALGPVEPLPTGSELFDYWKRRIGRGSPARIMDALRRRPELTKKEIAPAADISPTSSGLDAALHLLEDYGIIQMSKQGSIRYYSLNPELKD